MRRASKVSQTSGAAPVVTIEDEPEELLITAVCETTLPEQVLAFAAALVLLCLLWEDGGTAAQAMAAVGALLLTMGYLRARRQRRTTTLRVSAGELATSGYRVLALAVAVADLVELNFEAGDEAEPCGLYAFHLHQKSCLLPAVDPVECSRIIDAIDRRFPGLVPPMRRPTPTADAEFEDGLTLEGEEDPFEKEPTD
jgi:hypothetical protein